MDLLSTLMGAGVGVLGATLVAFRRGQSAASARPSNEPATKAQSSEERSKPGEGGAAPEPPWSRIESVERREFLQRVVEAAPSALIVVDEQGSIVLKNQETVRTFGYASGELLGASIDSLLPPEARAGHAQLRQKYLENPTMRKMAASRRLLGRRKDGSAFPIEVGLNPIRIEGGLFVLCAIVDRSDAQAFEETILEKNSELERINEELRGFSSAASHDLKAPLRAIQNAARWLEEDLPTDSLTPDALESLRLLTSRAGRMENLLDALLEYSRASRQDAPSEDFGAAQIVDDVVVLLGPMADKSVEVEGTLPRLRSPRAPFQQVLFNLVWNALKHGAGVPELRVVVRGGEDGSRVWFEVQDNGPGIDQRYHQKIFEVFQTLRPRDEVEGAGMGLALVKRIVEGFEGRVTVRSDLGQGATFRFDWPRHWKSRQPDSSPLGPLPDEDEPGQRPGEHVPSASAEASTND